MDLIDCQPIKKEELEKAFSKHQISVLSIINYPKIFYWEMSNPKPFPVPIRHLPKKSCRVWMQIEVPQAATRIENHQNKATYAKTEQELFDIAESISIHPFVNYKKPFFRVAHKDLDIKEKFYYEKDDLESVRSALLEACALQVKLVQLKQDAECYQMSELKEYMQEHKLVKSGSSEALQSRMVRHMLSQQHALELNSKQQPDAPPPLPPPNVPQEDSLLQEPSASISTQQKSSDAACPPTGSEPCSSKLPGDAPRKGSVNQCHFFDI